MIRQTTFFSALLGLIMSGCTTISPALNSSSDISVSPEAKLFGDYLAGTYADHIDNAFARSEYYADAFQYAQYDKNLGRKAVASAVAAADNDLARNLSHQLVKDEVGDPLARAVLGAYEITKKRPQKAAEYLEEDTSDLSVDILLDIMQGWNAVSLEKMDEADTVFSDIEGGGYFNLLGKLERAKLETSRGNKGAALPLFEEVMESDIAPVETLLSHVWALVKFGEVDQARENLQKFSDERGPFETGPVRVYLDALNSGDVLSGEALEPPQQAARSLTEASFGFFARNRAFDVAEIYLRFALMLDPHYDKAALWLGTILEGTEREDEALALFQTITPKSSYFVPARLSEANIYFTREESDKALEILEQANQRFDIFTTREALGRAQLVQENYAQALPIYDRLVRSMSEEDLKADIEPLYFRGVCYEREKQWPKAMADFKQVLEYEPENAEVLNYLGYTWVDRNENLDEAFAMIRKAVSLQPNNGAFVDSLGWAHYKLGQYDDARVQLEKAVQLSPSSATIIDHLGDVYWKLGRFREAGYQWERALEYDPTDDEIEKIKNKLAGDRDGTVALP